jgi:hypothetical protein
LLQLGWKLHLWWPSKWPQQHWFHHHVGGLLRRDGLWNLSQQQRWNSDDW